VIDPGLAVDKLVGRSVERLVRSHHERRLRRIGWSRALDPTDPGLWAQGQPPPRAGCTFEVLIDGAQALPRLAEELRKAVSHVHIAGWFVSPDFALVREPVRMELRALLAELAERIPVRVLVWAGSPLPLFRPDRKDVARTLDTLVSGTKIEAVADPNERPLHCHHEKIAVIDDGVAFVGGIDLTTEAGDRFDTNAHPARGELGWHDAACCLHGPAVTDVAAHFAQRWRDVTGAALPDPKPTSQSGAVELQVVRTVPEHIYESVPNGDFRILESYLRAFRSAERLVYVENQFLWSNEIVRILLDKIAHPPADDFRLVLLLPANPNDGRDDTRGQLADLIEADDGRGRVLACTLRALGEAGPCPVYVHAKIGIVDDRWLTLGSANLNEHSLFNDTELNIVTCDPELARGTRLRLWAEHLERSPDEVAGDPARVVDELWKPIAQEQHGRRQAGLPPTHRLCMLPGVSRRSRRVLGPLQGLLVDG
jgi:phosphatidylserine/phosphatidylglycerophosphate/cardiolipin synthase-like enzyme